MIEKFKNIKGILSRDEMRQIKAGSGVGDKSYFRVVCNDNSTGWIDTCYRAPDYCRNSGGEKSCN